MESGGREKAAPSENTNCSVSSSWTENSSSHPEQQLHLSVQTHCSLPASAEQELARGFFSQQSPQQLCPRSLKDAQS